MNIVLVKQTKNLQKYYHPVTLHHLKYIISARNKADSHLMGNIFCSDICTSIQ